MVNLRSIKRFTLKSIRVREKYISCVSINFRFVNQRSTYKLKHKGSNEGGAELKNKYVFIGWGDEKVKLYEIFPYVENEHIILRKIEEADVDALMQITENENVYKYIPPFLFKKSRKILITAIRNLGGRDFEKKKMIIAGIYLKDAPDKLIGLAEMFDYKKRANQITIGYRLNQSYWNRGIATEVIGLMVNYLYADMGVKILKAYVMPENIYSQYALLKNGFLEEKDTVQVKNWGGKEVVDVKEFTYTVV